MIKQLEDQLLITNNYLTPETSTQGMNKSAKHIKENLVIYLYPGNYSVASILEKALGEKKIRRYFDDELMKNLQKVEKVNIKKHVNLTVSGSVKGNENLDIKLKKLKINKGKSIKLK